MASFARKVQPAGSTEIYVSKENAPFNTKSKHEPDASFWHSGAQYSGVIVEITYSQKKRTLDRLAEDYLMDSDASVRVVVGLDMKYGKRGSRLVHDSKSNSSATFRLSDSCPASQSDAASAATICIAPYCNLLTSIPVQRATRCCEPHPQVPCPKSSRNNALLFILDFFLLITVAWQL